jgi:hypothetical protein
MDILIERGVDLSKSPLDENWHEGFFQRHPDVKKKHSRSLEFARFAANDPKIYRYYFELFKATCIKYDIQTCDMYNADKKDYAIGVSGDELVVIPFILRTQSRILHEINREWATTIECGSANGFILSLFYIFKAKIR